MEAERQLQLRLKAGWDGEPLGKCPKCDGLYYRIIPIGPRYFRKPGDSSADTVLVHTLTILGHTIVPDKYCYVHREDIIEGGK